jgi:hypothetical protein
MTAAVVIPGAFRSCRNASRKSPHTGPPNPIRVIGHFVRQSARTLRGASADERLKKE